MKLIPMKSYLSIIALLVFITGCGNGSPESDNTSQNKKKVVPVYVQNVQPSYFLHYLNVQGDVESDKTIMITPKIGATVESIKVKPGQKVQKGAILAQLDGEITRTQIQLVKTQLELAKTMYERQQELRKQNIGSEVEFLQGKAQYESAQSQLATLEEQFANYTIRATISGTVDQVNIKEGENIGPATLAFQLSNSDAMKVKAQISEAYITSVDPTDSVTIFFPSINKSISKTIDVVSKVINPSNRTFGIEINLPNVDGLYPNMMARLSINDVRLENQLVVPLNTLQNSNGIDYLFVAEKNGDNWVASYREVEIGDYYNNDLVIKKGLKAGDLLITEGYSELTDGLSLKIQEK